MNRTLPIALLISVLAALAFSASAMGQTSAQVAYQQAPPQTPANIPEIPSVSGAQVTPPSEEPEGRQEIVPTVAGEQRNPPTSPTAPSVPDVTPVANVPDVAPAQVAQDAGTLPVTGFDALLILGAAAAAGGVGFALRRAATTR